MKIAAWSGPRNLSTALMYSFAQHPDFCVFDEPFYGAYLAETDSVHPMQSDILASQSHDPKQVIEQFETATTQHTYLKLMTHHHLNAVPEDWFNDTAHLFLIRHPARVLASYDEKRDNPTLADIGFTQQAKIFQRIQDAGHKYAVIDAADIRADPQTMLPKLCEALGVIFDDAMLSWSAGPKPYDGVWASHWYNAVHKSTGFSAETKPLPIVKPELQKVLAAAMGIYTELAAFKLKP